MPFMPLFICWYDHRPWAFVNEGHPKGNYGDELAPWLARRLSGRRVLPVEQWPKHRLRRRFCTYYATVGSIIPMADRRAIVWGSGIIHTQDKAAMTTFLCVRGPRTRASLMSQGLTVPEVYGDPALLLPLLYNPDVEKKYELGIIPHFLDYAEVKTRSEDDSDLQVIDMTTNDIEATTRQILQCKRVVSSSLHGVIVSHAYGIPALWIRVSDRVNGDDVKFDDYFQSVGLSYPRVLQQDVHALSRQSLLSLFNEQAAIAIPPSDMITARQKDLLQSCPFLNSSLRIQDMLDQKHATA